MDNVVWRELFRCIVTITLLVTVDGVVRVWEAPANDEFLSFEEVFDTYKQFHKNPGPVIAYMGLYINSMYSIDEQNMRFSVNLLMRLQWRDPRLGQRRRDIKIPDHHSRLKTEIFTISPLSDAEENQKPADSTPENATVSTLYSDVFGEEVDHHNEGQIAGVVYDGEHRNMSAATHIVEKWIERAIWRTIWLPDITFKNEISSYFHTVSVPNRLLLIDSDGELRFPLDIQRCPIIMESFGHRTDGLIFRWFFNGSIEIDRSLEMSRYEIMGFERKNCSIQYRTGWYPCLQVDLILKRYLGYYLLQLYLPSLLIVILSWVGLWISHESVPARVTLSLLTVLTMTTQKMSANNSLPPVSYVKALDIWLTVSLVFVFLSLIEFAIVHRISRQHRSKLDRTYSRHSKNKRRPRSQCNWNGEMTLLRSTLDIGQTVELNLKHIDSMDSEEMNTPKQGTATNTGANTTLHSVEDFRGFGRRKSHSNKKTPRISESPSTSMRQADWWLNIERALANEKARKLDRAARFIFPFSFTIFNLIYWLYYIHQLHYATELANMEAI